MEGALRKQFIRQLRNERHRDTLLDQAQIDVNTLTFAKSISVIKTIEATVEHTKQRKNNEQPDVFQLRIEGVTVKGKCSKCGRNHKFKDCPAFGKTCYKCYRKKITSATSAAQKMIGSTLMQ